MVNPVYEAIFNYADRIGARDIQSLPGIWSYPVNDEWRIAINPRRYAIDTSNIDGDNGAHIHPMHCAIWRNGKPVADVSPFDCFHVDPSFDRDEFIKVLNEQN